MGTASLELEELRKKQFAMDKINFHFRTFSNFLVLLDKNINHLNIWLRLAPIFLKSWCVWQVTIHKNFNNRNLGTIASSRIYGQIYKFTVILWSKFKGQFCPSPGFACLLPLRGWSPCQKALKEALISWDNPGRFLFRHILVVENALFSQILKCVILVIFQFHWMLFELRHYWHPSNPGSKGFCVVLKGFGVRVHLRLHV